ncbi:MAG: exo-alpha-sialidase [Bacteroidaceae bacterium]|nr:exo-alpha-sialidase [Bacteroidaceae bacterium]
MKKSLLFTLLGLLVAAFSWAQAPFQTTTVADGQFAPNTTWYLMRIGAGGSIISDNAGADHIAVGRATTSYEDKDLWCFVDKGTEGYAIYNKQAGADKVLASHTKMSAIAGYGGTGGSTFPIMQPADALPEGYIGTWDIATSNKIDNVDGYFVKIHGTNYAINNFGGIGKLAFWAEGMDAGSTVQFEAAVMSIEILAAEGEFTASNANKTWHSKWESSKCEGFSLSTSANNMTVDGDYIAGYSGQSQSSTYTLTAPEGYVVAAYSFDYANTGGDGSYSLTLAVEGENYKSSAQKQHLAVEVAEPARIVTFVQSGANKGITFSKFCVTLRPDTKEPEPCFEVFPTPTSAAIPYRIPAIATAYNGDIIAVADYRHSRADIGMASYGRIDLHARISKDNGVTWGEIFPIVEGKGKQSPDFMNVGFGDPCIVADRESPRVMVLSCAGNVSFPGGTRNNHQNIARFYSDDNGQNWSAPVDIADDIYAMWDKSQNHGPVMAMFIGSGKIVQSRNIKVDKYYRLYCAVLLKNKNAAYTNFVLYSDNFGESWDVLGGVETAPVPSGGDEPKVEELPDGSILISSRCNGGRYYNIYSFTNSEKAEGSWGTMVFSGASNKGVTALSNSCNGEVLLLPVTRNADNKKMFLLLQSLPFGSGRTNVGIYYKELENLKDFVSADSIAANWDGKHQSSYLSSAYSTMCWQQDSTIGFLYEEDTHGTSGGGYTIVYKNYTIEYITDSAYTYCGEVDANAVVAEAIEEKTASIAVGEQKYVGSVLPEAVELIAEIIEAYKAAPSRQGYEAINAQIQNLPRIEVEAGAWYRLRNVARSNATLYLNPEASRVSTAKSNIGNANQLFSFVPAKNEGEYYLYNGNFEYFLGPLGNNETQPIVTSDESAAGVWRIESTVDGRSSVICTNKTGGNSGLHLAGDNTRLVPWTPTAEASLWYIEPLDSYTVSINEAGFAAVNYPFAYTLPEGVKAYTTGEAVTIDGVEALAVTEYAGETVMPNTPVILVGEAGDCTLAVEAVAEVAQPEGYNNSLKGTLKSASVSGSEVYTLSGKTMKKRAAAAGTIAANSAYYVGSGSGDVLQISEVPTGIENIATDGEAVKFYDLGGREVKNPARGIYVTSNGLKIFVK